MSAAISVDSSPATTVADPNPDDPGWPMTFVAGGVTYTIFEPRCDSWDGHDMSGRSVVSVASPNQAQPVFGVMTFNALTLVDKTTRTVTLAKFHLASADFPSARGQTENYIPSIRQNFPQHAPPLPLDTLESSLTLNTLTGEKGDKLNNLPPKVIVATQPSLLVYIDGPPVWRTVAGTDLQRVINTRMLLLKGAGQYYLHLFDGYLQASSLNGPWTVAKKIPDGIATAEKAAADTGQVDLMQTGPDSSTNKAPSLATSPVPTVYVSTAPTELIQLHGQPDYVAIAGTDLLYAQNTSGNVFKSLTDQQNYILISGRWYKAPSLNGPWEFVPGNRLPSDFANIPDTSPKENVKASVPGTSQAEEALIANSIPESAAVPRTNTLAAPQFDGPMQLAPIQGTPLHYVVNSPVPIIEEDPQSWYACQDGIWYAASAATGPWTVATFVPPVIYTIPADSPLHYLTYVQVYGNSPTEVYDGYTPGYMGTEVADDGTVVYGTGYVYTPWVGSVWYGPPITWGWGFAECWTRWWGWGFGCGFGWGWGWGWGYFPPSPWWCGFHHDFDHDRFRDRGGWRGYHGDHRDWANTGADVYRGHREGFANNGLRGQNGFGAQGRDRNSQDYGHAYNSRTGWAQAGQRGAIQNVRGAAWDTRLANRNRQTAFRSTVPAGIGRNYSFDAFGNQRFGYGAVNHSFQAYSRGNFYGDGFRTAPGGFQNTPNSFRGGAFNGGGAFHSSGGGFRGGGGGGGFHGGGGGRR
jgi:hypothetical protein